MVLLPLIPLAAKKLDVVQITGGHRNRMNGPYKLYLPQQIEHVLQGDYVVGDKGAGLTQVAGTIEQRLMQIRGLSSISYTEHLEGTDAKFEFLLIQMTSDVVDWVDGMQPGLVQWESHGGMMFHFKIMMIGIPRIKSTKVGQSGIYHGVTS